jgi:nicotinate-nucleotide--dimethylbenzimidazole phosphoribosyltransferase
LKEGNLIEFLKAISKIDDSMEEKIRHKLDNLTKPRKSLGRLEEIALRYAMIKGSAEPPLSRKVIFVFAGDHGVTEEGVSAYPKEVTYQMVYNFLRGGAAINVLARHISAGVRVVDIGVDFEFGKIEGLISRKIRRGTENFLKAPAMTREEALRAIEAGMEVARAEIIRGLDIAGVGDMGIGNTTSSAGIISVITGAPVENVTGRGTGIDDKKLRQKIDVIKRAIEIHKPQKDNPMDVLSKIGGLEIAGITGAILECASNRIPVVLDGVITTAGALIAYELNRNAIDYMFASHLSVEPGHKLALEYLGLKPLLDLNLRLGEGTGACLAINLIEAGIKILKEMASFDSAGVSKGN